jgi:uncharacterized lipoprotein YddW (UPF0748 family)
VSRRPPVFKAILRALVLFAIVAFATLQPLHPGGAAAFQDGGADSTASRPAPGSDTFRRGPEPYLPLLLRTTTVAPAGEIRALWVVRDALRSPQDVERMVDFARDNRFHLIFVQVRGRGDAYYFSATEPAGDLEYPIADFDPLEYVLILAHRAGISVHAWVNTFYVWSDPDRDPPAGHVFHRHPEWFLSDPSGMRMNERDVRWWQQDGIEGYYLAPGDPAVRRYIAGVVSEIVATYPVDGIHLDYVRYPGREYGFDPAGRTAFALRWGIDPVMLGPRRDELVATIGDDAVAAMDSLYTASRCAAVDSVVLAVRDAVGELPVSVAVVPDPLAARYEKGQDWASWVQRRWVDFVVPMAYNYEPWELGDRARILYNYVGRERLLFGLALHDGRSLHFADAVAVLREEGAMGVSVFSYNVLAGMRFPGRLLEEAFFTTPPDSLAGDPE